MAADEGVDLLWTTRNAFYVGAHQAAIAEAADLDGLGEVDRLERDIFTYRAYVELGSYEVRPPCRAECVDKDRTRWRLAHARVRQSGVAVGGRRRADRAFCAHRRPRLAFFSRVPRLAPSSDRVTCRIRLRERFTASACVCGP